MNANVKINADVSGFTDSMNSATKSVEGFSVSTSKVDKNANNMKKMLRAATKEAQSLSYQLSKMSTAELNSDIGKQMQQQLQSAMREAADLKDRIGDVNEEIANMASDTKGLDAFTQGIGVVSSGLSGLASVYGLVGGNTEKFAQALVTVNAIQNVANTITGIALALQKQSDLMVGLRAAKNAILGTSITAVAAAETAETAALTAETAATETATVAQEGLNTAMAANPIGAVIAAVAALAAGIYFLVDALSDASDETIATQVALEAFNEEVDAHMKTVAEQLSLYDQLKAEYDACGKKTDEFAKKVINNTNIQKRLGVTLKTVDDVHRFFANNSEAYRAACIARGNAMAAEAAKAVMLGKTLGELSKIQVKMMRGEEVNYSDVQKLIEAMGYSAKEAQQLIEEAGFLRTPDGIFGKDNIEASGASAADEMTKLLTKAMQGGMAKALDDMADAFIQYAPDIKEFDWTEELENNEKAATTGAKKTKSAIKGVNEEVKKVLTSSAGCDAVISDIEKKMKNLDHTSATYAQDMESLKKQLLGARVAKLSLIDTSSLKGLNEARSLIEDIIKSLPANSPALEDMKKRLNDVNSALFDMLAELAKNGDLQSLKEARSQIEKIISTLPAGSEELKKWIEQWRYFDELIKTSEQAVEDLKKGIEKGSFTDIDRQISELRSQLNNTGDAEMRMKLQIEIENLEAQKAKMKQALDGTVITPEVKFEPNKFSYRFNLDINENGWGLDQIGKMSSRELEGVQAHIDSLIEYQNKRIEQWEEKMKTATHEEKQQLRALITDAKSTIQEFNNEKVYVEIQADIKAFKSQLSELGETAAKDVVSATEGLYNVFFKLPDELDNCENAAEKFFKVISAGFSVFDQIKTIIKDIKELSDLFKQLSGAKDALENMDGVDNIAEQTGGLKDYTAAQDALTKSKEQGAMATQALTSAEQINSTTEQAGTGITLTNAAADEFGAKKTKEKAIANVGETVSETAKQNSKMGPFGWVAAIAAAAAVFGSLMAMMKFADGGIVGGQTTIGDRVVARLNAGEMVLNQGQQAKLFKMINDGTVNGSNVNVGGTVRVKGSDLVVALHNYEKISGRKL